MGEKVSVKQYIHTKYIHIQYIHIKTILKTILARIPGVPIPVDL